MISPHVGKYKYLNKLRGSGSRKCFYKCKSGSCIVRRKVGRTSSKRIFGCVVPNGMTHLTYVYCSSPNMIYLISFK